MLVDVETLVGLRRKHCLEIRKSADFDKAGWFGSAFEFFIAGVRVDEREFFDFERRMLIQEGVVVEPVNRSWLPHAVHLFVKSRKQGSRIESVPRLRIEKAYEHIDRNWYFTCSGWLILTSGGRLRRKVVVNG